MSCEGWKNYETRAVALWVDSEERSQRYWEEVAQEAWGEAENTEVFGRKENAVRALADRLEGEIMSAAPDKGLYGDLLTHALQSVEWAEAAERLLADMIPHQDKGTRA